ncbi:SDR family oxidoreductase [Pseudomonas matsuisoli]|uniref:NAD-dependent dehydratase n=1 Tax=Pseudomonas matsuisoli TaxID=1515666 RepID=A0A917Q1V6_9PSED|nr:SDR family oxidoreductase [Pseudomonas matsuisoli]GGK05050.1 NAD-dependent dehydratase [Pseudomonas matsuisoli]
MSKVFIIGATGGVGSRLGPLLVGNGHSVSGLHRSPEQAEALSRAGVRPYLGDLMTMTAEDLAAALKGHDVIVFSAGAAGSGLERTTAIDGEGVTHTIAAAKSAGIKRVYLVSAFMDAARGGERKPGFEHYMSVKRASDNALVASGLDWVILRPGTLVSEDGNGRVSANLALPYGSVARGNVAAVLAALIDTPAIRREIIELTDGDRPVREAVQALVRRHE